MSTWPESDFTACAEAGEHVPTQRHPAGVCPHDEPPAPTLTERAQSAQDAVGWARMATDDDGGTEFASATLAAARVVTDLARQVDRLTAEVARLQDGSTP